MLIDADALAWPDERQYEHDSAGALLAVTRLDVARRAGTSPALVSYVINGGPRKVAPKTEAKIRAAIEDLGYRPNRVARSLRMSQTFTLGLVIPDSANPYFAELAIGVEDAAREAGYSLFIGNSAENVEREMKHLEVLLDHQVDGIVVVPSLTSSKSKLTLPNVPTVLLDRRAETNRPVPSVTVDNRGGAYEATTHLIDHGRTSIAGLTGPENVLAVSDRTLGFRDAVRVALGNADPTIVHTAFGARAGYDAVTQLFTSARAPIDALFVASDEQAIGAIKALHDLDIDCPRDVAVLAFDGIQASEFTIPGLTTMSQPLRSMGEHAVRSLISLAKGLEVRPLELPTTLIRRESCGCTDRKQTA